MGSVSSPACTGDEDIALESMMHLLAANAYLYRSDAGHAAPGLAHWRYASVPSLCQNDSWSPTHAPDAVPYGMY